MPPRSTVTLPPATGAMTNLTLISYPVPETGIQHAESRVTASIGFDDIGQGTLYITENYVLWLNSQGQGIELEYRQICLHAVSRDLQAFPREHLLCHYEGKLPNSEESGENEDDDDSECGLTEIRFSPDDKDALDAMFKALATCQTLHPDSDCQLSGDDDFEDADEDAGVNMGGGDAPAVIYDSEEGFQLLTEEGRAIYERLNQMLLQGNAGAGDGELSDRTRQLHISNGHHDNGEAPMDDDQFVDADDDPGQ